MVPKCHDKICDCKIQLLKQIILIHSGSFQRGACEPRVPERVDPYAPRNPRATILRPPGHGPPLQVGHCEEGSRGQKENVNSHQEQQQQHQQQQKQ